MNDVRRHPSWPFSVSPAPSFVVPATAGERRKPMQDAFYKPTPNDKLKEAILMEAVMKRGYEPDKELITRLKNYFDQLKEYCGAGEYKRYGKYLVKETFEGDATLTDLLTEYIERTASLKY